MDNNPYCRGCMGTNLTGCIDLKQPFWTGSYLTYEEVFYLCTEIKTNADHFSQFLCKKCSETLKISFGFRELCQQSHQLLQKLRATIQESKVNILDVDPACNDRDFKCMDCGMSFETQENLLEHVFLMKGKEGHFYSCDICQKKMKLKSSVAEHMTLYHITVECNVCNQSFAGQKSLLLHQKTIHGSTISNATCPICGKGFMKEKVLKRHIQIVHERPDEQFTCEICGRQNTTKVNLQVHMRVHTNERPYGCHLCGKTFKQKSALNCHLESHAPEKMHKCEVCGIRIKRASYLKEHRKMHFENNEVPCDVCGMVFKNARYLKSHQLSHQSTEEKCSVCGKVCKNKRSLRDHMKYHGEFKHKCKHCDKAFTRQGHLKEHMDSTHEATRKWICEFANCDKSYYRSSHLRYHEKVVHLGAKASKES